MGKHKSLRKINKFRLYQWGNRDFIKLNEIILYEWCKNKIYTKYFSKLNFQLCVWMIKENNMKYS